MKKISKHKKGTKHTKPQSRRSSMASRRICSKASLTDQKGIVNQSFCSALLTTLSLWFGVRTIRLKPVIEGRTWLTSLFRDFPIFVADVGWEVSLWLQ